MVGQYLTTGVTDQCDEHNMEYNPSNNSMLVAFSLAP